MTIDAEDRLWVAHWDGHCVACYDPWTGRPIEKIELPTPKVTSCFFGGDRLETLFISTAIGSEDGGWTDTAQHPEAGAVFTLNPGCRGTAPNYFSLSS